MVDVEKLLAAIAEAERKALAVPEHLRVENWTHPGPWVMHGVNGYSVHEVALARMTGRQGEALAEHIASNDPDAVLRRCEADRKLIELHSQSAELGWLCALCGGEGQNLDCTYPCDTLRLVAAGYGITEEEK